MKIKPEINRLVADIKSQAKSRSYRAANELRNAELVVLSGQRHGRVYRKAHTKRAKYTASAPGEAPAVRTGTLRRSWRPVSASDKDGKSTTIRPAIVTNVEYAPYLDEGHGMDPRQFKEPIKEKAMPNITKIYTQPYLNK